MMASTYWAGNGKNEDLYKACVDAMKAEHIDTGNEHWALLNGMAGIYYAKYNDGDGLRAAIANNRVHGFESLEAFQALCIRVGAPECVRSYLVYGGRGAVLERAMDATIEFVAAAKGVVA